MADGVGYAVDFAVVAASGGEKSVSSLAKNGLSKSGGMISPTQRRTCKGRRISCPGRCNRNRHAATIALENKVDDTGDLERISLEHEEPVTLTDLASLKSPKASDYLAEDPVKNQLEDPVKNQVEDPAKHQVEEPEVKCSQMTCDRKGCAAGFAEECAMTSSTSRASRMIVSTLSRTSRDAPDVATSLVVSLINFPVILKNLSEKSLLYLIECSPSKERVKAGAVFTGGHLLLAYLALNNTIYQTFLAAEVCGLITFMFWSICGSVPL